MAMTLRGLIVLVACAAGAGGGCTPSPTEMHPANALTAVQPTQPAFDRFGHINYDPKVVSAYSATKREEQ
jgi:hypothetical protein